MAMKYPKSSGQLLREATCGKSSGRGGGAGMINDAQDMLARPANLQKKECWNCGKRIPIYYTKCPKCKSDV